MTRVFIAVIGIMAACAHPGLAAAPDVQTVRVPNGGSYPQAQVDARGRIHLLYVTGDPARADVFYVRSDDGGKSFSPPLRVNGHPKSIIIVGTVRGPHLAIGRGDRVYVAWMGSDESQPKAPGRATPMLYTRLNDAGDAFEPQRNVIQKHPGLDGGGSVAADPDGNVYVAWHAPNGAEDEEHRDVWVARSTDDGKTFAEETAALPEKTGVCGCCGMRIFAEAGGKVFIAYRSAHEKVHRDVHLLASDDYGKTFHTAAVDPWTVGTCVMSTASLAPSPHGLLAAWETKEQVRLARMVSDSARPSVAPVAGNGSGGKHPSVAVNSRGESVAAWAVGTGWNKGGSVAWQAYDAEGRSTAVTGRAEGLPVWSLPAAAALPDGTFRVFY
jgi:hypothetical protein